MWELTVKNPADRDRAPLRLTFSDHDACAMAKRALENAGYEVSGGEYLKSLMVFDDYMTAFDMARTYFRH